MASMTSWSKLSQAAPRAPSGKMSEELALQTFSETCNCRCLSLSSWMQPRFAKKGFISSGIRKSVRVLANSCDGVEIFLMDALI